MSNRKAKDELLNVIFGIYDPNKNVNPTKSGQN